MSDELDEIREIFIEECKDGLAVMEKGLLQLDQGDLGDAALNAVINEIFRAAHSIKGGGATFGFPEIAAFTHVLETLLGCLRDGSLPVDRAAIDLLLAAVDSVADMVAALAEGAPSNEAAIADVRARMEVFMVAPSDAEAASVNADAAPLKTPANAVEKAQSKQHEFIRVDIDKVDDMINLVGELIITQSMLSRIGDDFHGPQGEALRDALDQLRRNTRELQESAMRIRMLPIDSTFQRFPRMVRDLSHKIGKQVELRFSGEGTELDKTVLEKLADPLTHLIRNALDHGLEMPPVRRAMGKPEVGELHLNAYHQGGHIYIEVSDDGAGLDTVRILAKAREKGLINEDPGLTEADIHRLIFLPGFSTAEAISDLSGRGVGMDVVVRNIEALGGYVEVCSVQGMGSTFTIRLPLTLAILDGQLVRVADDIYILPLLSIVESVQLQPGDLNSLPGHAELFRLRGEYIQVLRMRSLFDVPSAKAEARVGDGLLVVVESDGRQIGIVVDALLNQQQVVIKSLETNYRQVAGIQGATILGDGRVALIVDTAVLATLHKPLLTRPRAA